MYFFLFCKFNHYIFENINKLEILKDIDNYNLLIINNNKPYFLINDNLLLINTWAGAHRDIDNNVFDSDLVNLTKQYYKCINNINKEFNLNIKYNTELTLPKLPDINIDKILEFKNKCYKSNKDSKFLFYYNYLPMSDQNFPISSSDDHDDIIIYLSKLENYIIFIPNLSNKLLTYIISNNILNIIDCNIIFNLTVDNNCYNLYYYTYITNYCDTVIYYDTGRSFTYINDNFITNNNNKIHIATNCTYYNKLNINNFLIPTDYVKLFICNNKNDIINNLEKYLLPNSNM